MKHRSMTIMGFGMALLSAALFAALLWLLWETVPLAGGALGHLSLVRRHLCGSGPLGMVSAPSGKPVCRRSVRNPGRPDVRRPAGGLSAL